MGACADSHNTACKNETQVGGACNLVYSCPAWDSPCKARVLSAPCFFRLTDRRRLVDNLRSDRTESAKRMGAYGHSTMRRLIVFTPLCFSAGFACVSNRPVERSTPLHPIYRGHEARRRPAGAVRDSVPVAPEPRQSLDYNPAWFPPGGRISPRWTYIVIHHSATRSGGANRFDKYHREINGWDELGYHFVIGNGTDTPDGYVEVGPRWRKQKHGAHCKTPNNYFNEHGIGICLVGDFSEERPTRRQLDSLERLVRFLSRQCHIPPSRVTTHNAVKRTTECPGRHFPLASFQRSLSARPSMASRISAVHPAGG